MARFSGKQGKSATKNLRELKRDKAKARQAEFDASYLERKDQMDRKTFGELRRVERLASPRRSVTIAGNLAPEPHSP